MASLNQNTNILGIKNAKHLLRRASFVYTKTLIDQYAVLTPNEALNLLLTTNPLSVEFPYDPLPIATPDGFWTESTALATSFTGQARKGAIVSGWWWYNAINSPNLKYKMSHFLSTCFTVETSGSGTPTEFYDYIRLLLFYSYGNYKTLAKKMTLNNSMLTYLNNTTNTKSSPNENYAREFLELFTILKGEQVAEGDYTNYTEHDVQQAARVLTGFTGTYGGNVRMNYLDKGLTTNIAGHAPNPSNAGWTYAATNLPTGLCNIAQHDIGNKTFSAAFGNQTINGSNVLTGSYTAYD